MSNYRDLARTAPRGTGWLNSATVSSDIYFWVMNNRWRTNYKISQEGPVSFRYSLEAYDPLAPELKKRGMERAQPLLAVVSADTAPTAGLFRVKGTNKVAVSTIRPSADGTGYVVRLQNTGAQSVNPQIEWGSMQPADAVMLCDNAEKTSGIFDSENFWLKPYECLTFKIVAKKIESK